MNVNDPYIIAALAHWTGDPSPLDIDWRANDMREADRDRAAEARIGGAVYRGIFSMPHSRSWTDDTIDATAKAGVVNVQNNRKSSRRAYLPESAFDWPVYQAAQSGPRGYANVEPFAHAYFHPGPQDCRDYAQCHARAYSIPESENRALHGDR